MQARHRLDIPKYHVSPYLEHHISTFHLPDLQHLSILHLLNILQLSPLVQEMSSLTQHHHPPSRRNPDCTPSLHQISIYSSPAQIPSLRIDCRQPGNDAQMFLQFYARIIISLPAATILHNAILTSLLLSNSSRCDFISPSSSPFVFIVFALANTQPCPRLGSTPGLGSTVT